HLERLPTVEVLEVVRDAAVEIVGVDTLGPTVAHFLLERTAGEVEPGVIEVVALAVDAGAPHHDRRVFYEQPIFAFADGARHRVVRKQPGLSYKRQRRARDLSLAGVLPSGPTCRLSASLRSS